MIKNQKPKTNFFFVVVNVILKKNRQLGLFFSFQTAKLPQRNQIKTKQRYLVFGFWLSDDS
jgi:hypothetical protein